MIKFKKLDIQSFKSIFNCTINFDELKGELYSLEGINHTVDFASSNGAGKSTICDALSFVLYGTTDGISLKKADYQNKNTSIKLKLRLDLDIQDTNYIIERTDKDFKLFKEGEDISELTKTDTEKKFLSILNLTKAEFFNFTYLSQTSSGSFLTKTPSEKLNCIKDFIFGEELLQIQSKIDNYLKEIKNDINDANINLASINSAINTLNEFYSHKEDKKETFPLTITEYKEKRDSLQKDIAIKDKLKKNLSVYNNEYSNLKRKMASVKEQFNKAKNNICPTCGQHLKDDNVLNKIKEDAKQIKIEADNCKTKMSDVELKLKDYDYDIYAELNKINSIIATINEQEKNSKDYDKILEDIRLKTEDKKKLEEKQQYLDFKLKQVQQLQKYFKTDFISYIQQAFLSEIENYLNLYCRDVFNADFKLLFSNNSLELTIGDKPYSYYSGGERERIDILFVFAIKVALMNFTNKCTNLFICDESLRGQDSQAFEGCIELINSLTSAEDLTTILVSHRDVEYQSNKIIIERFDYNTKITVVESGQSM